MARPLSNVKKVRGWKRRLRQLERLRESHLTLDPSALERYQAHYVKLWLDPWDRLVPRNPPNWYRRAVLRAFGQIYDSWRATLEDRDRPYFLQLWLFHPRFHESQVVAAVDDKIDWYTERFRVDPALSDRPPSVYRSPRSGIDGFRWTPCADEEMVEWSEEECTPGEWGELHSSAVATRMLSSGEVEFRLRRGELWVGERP